MALETPTIEEVRAVINTPASDIQVQGAIDDAVLIAEGCPKVATYTAGRQRAIVKYLAAHLLSQQTTASGGAQGPLTQKALGDASESYAQATLGDQLKGTLYGQQALSLDPSGCLASLGKQKAFVRFLC